MIETIHAWHEFVASRDPGALRQLLAEDVVFHSPVVHRPQPGREITMVYLLAAMKVLGNDQFHYLREIIGERHAALEFSTIVDGVEINGVDLIEWNDAGQIVDFKVMVRPLKAINTLHALMAAKLA
ncbi:MAG TPA: nuclear transport factor 2 family protein [Xanthomonadales bacterium]|nr:nuclear transport factor 2 family protein [Xanthomonadales bacterium]